MIRVLVIDDEVSIRESLDMFLREKGYDSRCAGSANEGFVILEQWRPHILILDIRLPDISGLEMLKPIKVRYPEATVIMITAYHDMETTIEAMRQGAYDYIHKPLDVDELEESLQRAVHLIQAHQQTAPIPKNALPEQSRTQLVGKSKAMQRIIKTIGMLTENRASVLLEGETGTGKEAIARVIHERSAWGGFPFVTVDCTTLVDTLMENELFGHEHGAFTGAVKDKKGRLELAGQGTIFFDEIGELPTKLQAKLLRFLESREFTRVGGSETLYSSARIIAATNRDLAQMSGEGRFRKDLYFRLKVFTIHVPPLRERDNDLHDLVPFFLQRINRELKTNVNKIEQGAMALLKRHSWPGNVRELINALTQVVLESRSEIILEETVAAALNLPDARPDLAPSSPLKQSEREQILNVMRLAGWNISAASRTLGLSRPTLRKRLKEYHIRKPVTKTDRRM